MPGANPMMVEVPATTLRVHERAGHGSAGRPTLVFLHYFGGSGRTWIPVMDALAAAGWRCFAPDLRGFGESPAPGPDWPHYTVDTMADDVHELLGRLRLESIVVVGHSMGGKVALALAARRPAGLRGMALLAPSPAIPEPMESAERVRLLAGHGDRKAMEKTLDNITARPLPEFWREAALEDNLRASAPAWRAWLEHGSREDISGRLPQIEVPVHIAVGGRDRTITAALAERAIFTYLPTTPTKLVSVPNAGHLLPLEASSEAARFVSEACVAFEENESGA